MKRNSNSFSSSQAKSSLLHALLLLLFGIGSLFQLALQKKKFCAGLRFVVFFVSIYCPRTTALKKQPAAADVEVTSFELSMVPETVAKTHKWTKNGE